MTKKRTTPTGHICSSSTATRSGLASSIVSSSNLLTLRRLYKLSINLRPGLGLFFVHWRSAHAWCFYWVHKKSSITLTCCFTVKSALIYKMVKTNPCYEVCSRAVVQGCGFDYPPYSKMGTTNQNLIGTIAPKMFIFLVYFNEKSCGCKLDFLSI